MSNNFQVDLLNLVRDLEPIDTGRLRYQATSAHSLGANGVLITIDGDIAPYIEQLDKKGINKNLFSKTIPNAIANAINSQYSKNKNNDNATNKQIAENAKNGLTKSIDTSDRGSRYGVQRRDK